MNRIGELFRLKIVLPFAEKLIGTRASYWYRQIENMKQWSREDILAWQNAHLQSFVKHAYEHTAYYRSLFDTLGLKPYDIRCIDDLKKLPVVNKMIVNQQHDKFIPDNIQRFNFRSCKTGGTTGEPMLFFCDEDTWGYVNAAKIFAWKTTTYQYGDPFVALGSASLFSQKASLPRRLYDKIRNEVALNSVNLDDARCKEYISIIKKNKIKFLYGYAGSIFVFARYISLHKVDMSQIEAVFTTSETLTDSYRTFIEQVFGCKVMDCYGARDAGMNAYEIERNSYHVGYNCITEIVNEIEPNVGSVLTTNILNYSFPLIRYQFGDEAELASCVDESEYNGQVIRRVLGRTSDVMRLGNGRNLTATGFSMIMKEFDIVAFDVRKTADLEVVLRIQPVVGKYSFEQENRIVKTIKNYIGEDCKLVVEHVESFEPLKNGKRRYFYNESSVSDD